MAPVALGRAQAIQNRGVGVRERWEQVRARLGEACREAGRDPGSVVLVAVTKSVPIEAILEAYQYGQRHFGESRLQEALPKIEALPSDIVWHFIGNLQSNKARKAAQRFGLLHSVWQESQLNEIAKLDHLTDVLFQINVGREAQKQGILPEDLDEWMRKAANYETVRFRGFMTIGPEVEEAELSRVHFRALAEMGRCYGAEWLSMGMSSDFVVAIQEGATHIRVGTAVFGDRN